jgi:hypothetical protein
MAQAHAPAAAAPRPAKRKRRRRWPWVLLVLLLLLVLIVVAAPALLSTSPARSFVVGKINQNLNGKVKIDDWSLGWMSPVRITGVKVFDKSGVQIVELPHLTTELTLLDAARGHLKLGKVTVEGLDVLVRRDAQGNLNLSELMGHNGAAKPKAAGGGPGASSGSSEETKLPDVSGELHMVNCRATYEDQLQGQTFQFPSIAGTVKFPDINQPIDHALEIACKVGNSPPGKLNVAGKADVADNNVLRADRADVDEKVTVQGVELGGLSFLFGKDSGIQKLAGVTDALLTVRYKGKDAATAEGTITSTGVAAAGPALKGDTFATQKLQLVLPPTTVNMAGSDKWQDWSVRVGTGGTDTISLVTDQGRVQLASDAKLQSLLNLSKNEKPGAAGRLRADVDLNVGQLARQMPKTFSLQEGLTLESGRLTHATDIELAADRATVRKLETHLTEVRGQSARGPVSLQPIDVAFTTSTFGGGWTNPDVRDLNLTLRSGFANAQFGGKDIAQLAGSASGDLKRLRDELGQVVDFGALQLAGPFAVRIDSKGDVVGGGPSTVHAEATVTDLLVEGLTGVPSIRQRRVLLSAGGEVRRTPGGSVSELRGIQVVFNTGDERQPTVDAQITGAIAMREAPAAASPPTTAPAVTVASSSFQIAKLNVDLPRAKTDFGALVPALDEYSFQQGTVSVAGGGNYDGSKVAFDTRVALNDLTMSHTAKPVAGAPPARPVEVLRAYALTADAGGTWVATAAGAQTVLSKLSVRDNRKMLALDKSGDQDLRLAPTAGGKLQLDLDLSQLNDVVRRLGAENPEVVASAQGTQLRSGRLGGTVELTQAQANQVRVVGNLQGSQITVAGAGGEALRDESLTLALQARAPQDFSSLAVDSADVKGSLLSATVRNADVRLKVGQGAAARPAGTAEMLRSAEVTADVPELAKLQAFTDAFSAPDAQPAPRAARAPDRPARGSDVIGGTGRPAVAAAQPAARAEVAPAPPLRYAGSMNLKLTVMRQGERTLITPTLTGRNVTVSRGRESESLGDVNVTTAVSFVPVPPPAAPVATVAPNAPVPTPAAPGISEQIRDLQVPQLTATLAGSEFTLAEPLVVSDMAALNALLASFSGPPTPGGPAPATVKTALRGKGDIGRLAGLMKVLQAGADQGQATAAPDPESTYAGTYSLEQRVTGGKEGLVLAGTLNVDNFAVVDAAPRRRDGGGTSPAGGFAEKAIRLDNDIQLDAGRQVLSIRNVALNMETTKALELKLTGNVLDFSTQRRLESVQGTLGYDWARLWEMVRPMMSKEQQENLKLRIAGQARRTFGLGGSYPAVGPDGRELAFNESIKSLTGHFEGGFDVVEVNGLTIEKLELPMTLRDGMLAIAYHDRPAGQNYPPAAACNGGKLNLGGATVSLADATPRLNLPKNLKLLEGATLNPVFSDRFGNMINNPLFISPTEARGLVDVTVVQCDRLPLDSLVLKNAPENDGRAEFLFSIGDVYLGTPRLLEALKLAGQSEFARSMQGDIRESRVIIEKGRTRQDLVFNIGEKDRPLRIKGATVLDTKAIDLEVTIPPQLLQQLGDVGRQLVRLYPQGVPVPFTGTATAPQPNFQKLLQVRPEDLPGLVGGLLNRGSRDRDNAQGASGRTPATTTQPAAPPPPERDPLKDLIDLVGGNRDKGDKPNRQQQQQQRRDSEQQQRQRQQQQRRRQPQQQAPPASGSDRINRDPQ